MIFLLIDIETTGFNRESDNILEVGYMKIESNTLEILGSGSFYFYKPEWVINNQAQSVHKLTEEFLQEYANDFTVNLARLYTMCYNAIIVGKNSHYFDVPMIKSFLRRYAGCLDSFEQLGYLDLQDKYTDAYRAHFYKKYGVATKKKGTLSELVEMIGYTQEQVQKEFKEKFPDCPRTEAHGALYDVYMTYLLLKNGVDNMGMSLRV